MNLSKIEKDKLYKKLWQKTQSEELLTKSGFFDDGLISLDYHLNILTTPVDKISSPKKSNPVVLLTTGGFAPVHEGHLEMMKSAKEELIKKGYDVIGGYFSPSHDSYVHKKYPGSDKLSIYEKIELLRLAVDESDFLMVDPWEGLYTPSAINFTDVIFRLDQYLFKHLGYKVNVAYVFGGDNSGFARVFQNSDYLAVCVSRNNKDSFIQLAQELKDESNILFIHNNPYESMASRDIIKTLSKSVDYGLPYLVRDDLSFYGIDKTCSERVKKIIQDHTPCSVVTLDWLEQQKYVDSLNYPLINLDPLVKGGVKVEVSRIFSLATGQYRSYELINRPHSLPLNQQVSKIPPGDYCLVEDDVASGFTVNYLKSLLPKGVNVKDIKTLTEYSFHQNFSSEKPFNFFDIVDMRDFILGLPHGGLVIKLPNGTIARSIYALPFVNLTSRAKIDPREVTKMSKEIWVLNENYYSNSNKKLKDLDLYTQNLFLYLGFSQDDLVKDICREIIRMHYV